MSFSTPQEAREKGIETIYQDLALADNLSIGANIFLGREPMRKAFGFLPVLDRKAMAVAAKQTMGRLDFHVSRLDAPVSNFSGGQRQAVAIGRAVYWDAQILIMDEPTAALGVPEQRKVISLIHQLKAQGRGRNLHLAQSAGHFCRLRPHRRAQARRPGGRTQDLGDQPRRSRQADGWRVGREGLAAAGAPVRQAISLPSSLAALVTPQPPPIPARPADIRAW